MKLLLKRDLSDQEQLLQSFGGDSDPSIDSDDDVIDLDLKKNYFYVVNPDGKIVDCAKIYSFMHEENIYQRIVAKTLKDADNRLIK